MEPIKTDRAPAAIGPYSQGVRCGAWVFTSGQLPVDPATGTVPEGIAAQTEQALRNALAVVSAAGDATVVKATLFIRDMADFPIINEVYGRFFPAPCPARSCIEAARLPKDVSIEVELTAVIE